MSYNTEQQFKRAFISLLKHYYYDVTCIESHRTANGIPDLFVQGYLDDCWIELKNNSKQSVFKDSYSIDWRPGQQAWMMNYYSAHRFKNGITIEACLDGWIIFPHIYYTEDQRHVPCDDCIIVMSSVLKKISIPDLIRYASHMAMLTDFNPKDTTNREALVEWINEIFGNTVDYDTDILWNDADSIDKQYDLKAFMNRTKGLFFELELNYK